jgi:protein-disulfide isomerase
MKNTLFILSTVIAMSLVGCKPSPDQLKKVLEENPDIVTNAIEKNPDKFVTVINAAFQKQRGNERQKRAETEKKQRDAEFSNPKKPILDKKRAILGPSNAPITIVEYSDFQCPYCTRGYQTVQEIKKKYGKKVRFMYKHLPLSFHPQAMPAAKYFEAIALQSHKKAYAFHDQLFENQQKLTKDGEKYMQIVAKKLNVNMSKLKKDLTSTKVSTRIEADMAEAKKFGFSGTPAFLVNGVSLKGAYPASAFIEIIERQLAKK